MASASHRGVTKLLGDAVTDSGVMHRRAPFEREVTPVARRRIRRAAKTCACARGRAERSHPGKRTARVKGWGLPEEAEAARDGRTVERPNHQLAALIAEAGFSSKGLARRVVDRGRSRGYRNLRYNHSSVERWLRGEQPRPPTPELLGEVFSVALGRPVSPRCWAWRRSDS